MDDKLNMMPDKRGEVWMSSSAGLASLLPRETWKALLACGAVRRFEKGEILMRQGEPVSYVFILASGRVKVSKVDPEGNELLLAVRGVAEIVGEMAVLGGGMRSATVTALNPCITYVLSGAAFLRIIREHRVEENLLRYLVTRQRESDDARADLAGLNATQRVGRVLVRFASVSGTDQSDLNLSQDELAAATGLSRASVAASLAVLRRRGLVVTSRRSVAIRDFPKLRDEFG